MVAVEMDRTLEPVLEEHAAGHPNLAYILGDALKVAPEELAALADRLIMSGLTGLTAAEP